MALFKEKLCTHCGKKTNMLTRIKLENDEYICGKCVDKMPSEMSEELTGRPYGDFFYLRNYVDEVNPVLAKRFRETHKFHGIHLDTAHDLFYLDGLYPTIYFQLKDLDEFELEFTPDEVKDGFLGAKVTGKIYLRVRIEELLLFVDKVIAKDVKASAKIGGVVSKKVTYENPKGMDEFIHHMLAAREHALNAEIDRLSRELDDAED